MTKHSKESNLYVLESKQYENDILLKKAILEETCKCGKVKSFYVSGGVVFGQAERFSVQ